MLPPTLIYFPRYRDNAAMFEFHFRTPKRSGRSLLGRLICDLAIPLASNSLRSSRRIGPLFWDDVCCFCAIPFVVLLFRDIAVLLFRGISFTFRSIFGHGFPFVLNVFRRPTHSEGWPSAFHDSDLRLSFGTSTSAFPRFFLKQLTLPHPFVCCPAI